MNLTEQQIAVCEKLPELIQVNHITCPPCESENFKGVDCYEFRWLNRDNFPARPQVNWPTEGLQICHEAERLLRPSQLEDYCEALSKKIVMYWKQEGKKTEDFSDVMCAYMLCNATYEQRLEALCRVWWPERFV